MLKEDARTPWGITFIRSPGFITYAERKGVLNKRNPLVSYAPYFIEMCGKAKIQLDFDKLHNRFKINVEGIRYIRLSSQLAYMLGFPPAEYITNDMAKFSPELRGGVNFIYVYAPGLVENTELGGYTTPLLRIVSIRHKPSSYIEEVYIDEQYKRIIQKEVSMIKIELRNSEGRLIPFNWGEVIVSLKFKKDNAAYNI